MSTDHVPAWKKLGLKVKENKPEDILSETSSLKAKRKQTENASDQKDGTKKPPKRVKVPKSERKSPPESDQLAYLKQYHSDKSNWKFSKQKQNWIIKNCFLIPESYEEALVAYIEGLQGGSRSRVEEEAMKIIERWNEFMNESDSENENEENKEDKHLPNTESQESDKTAKPDSKDSKDPKQEKPKETPPEEPQVKRAQKIVKILTGNLVTVDGI